ncbi:hypothetical protein SK128_026431 [Halocaridina rubra]|uniref:Uncharacterized protein n=1 Tax=Halocaridina rubra TaxID=373956 RepID=A0AAN8W994_HALRR
MFQALRVMRHFPPETRVMTAVRFSKSLYAQTLSSRYTPDVRTGWELPPPTHSSFKTHDLGMKLACGFELLVCTAGGVTPVATPTTSAPPSTDSSSSQLDIANNPKWLRYHQSLFDKGYFRGELEGSNLYKELEDRARQFFVANMMSGDSTSGEDVLSAGSVIIKLMSKINVDHDFYKERATRLVPADDDNWLNITPDALDEWLESKFGVNGSDVPQGANESEVMNSLSAFLGHISDMEGAEVPQDLQDRIRKLSTLSTRKSSSGKGRKISGLMVNPQIRKISNQSNISDTSNSSEMSSFSNKVDFNADSFTDALANILVTKILWCGHSSAHQYPAADLSQLSSQEYKEFGVPEDDYWNHSEDESSGMSSYGEEDLGDGTLSRKSSNTSQKSSASTVSATSSGVDTQMKEYMREMERELAATNLGKSYPNPNEDEDGDDEFDDVENFEPVKVDMKAVQDLVKTYTAQNGMPGPASSLLGSLGIKPKTKM